LVQGGPGIREAAGEGITHQLHLNQQWREWHLTMMTAERAHTPSKYYGRSWAAKAFKIGHHQHIGNHQHT
jgi:hypothetical protein